MKAWGSLRPEDPRGLKSLAQALGPRFHRGVVLYQGRETVPFAKDLRTTGTVPGAYRVRLKVASLTLGGRGRGRGHGGGPSGGLSPPSDALRLFREGVLPRPPPAPGWGGLSASRGFPPGLTASSPSWTGTGTAFWTLRSPGGRWRPRPRPRGCAFWPSKSEPLSGQVLAFTPGVFQSSMGLTLAPQEVHHPRQGFRQRNHPEPPYPPPHEVPKVAPVPSHQGLGAGAPGSRQDRGILKG